MSQQINLLGPRFRNARFSYTSAQAMLAAVAVAVALTAGLGAFESHKLRTVEAEAARTARALKEAALAHEKALGASGSRKQDAQIASRLLELENHVKKRQEVVDALNSGAVGTTSGFSEYMRSFSRQRLDGVWLTGFDIARGGNDLTIVGRALGAELVPVYLQRLNREAPMQGRRIASMAITQPVIADAPRSKPAEEETRTALPAHVEFVISSGDATEARKRVAGSK